MKDHATPIRGSQRVAQSPLNEGRFGRMFRRLPSAPQYGDDVLKRLADGMREPVAQPGGWNPDIVEDFDNPAIPAAYTYFGQFLDHDITFDAAPSFDRINDPDALVSFRTPRFDLDSIYGSGPEDEPFQYQGGTGPRLLIDASNAEGEPDLPRNEDGIALIGDPRNDDNVIVSQLHLVFLQLHNKFVDEAEAGGLTGQAAFLEAQRQTRWHYQWVIAHDFLPRIVPREILAEVFPEPKTKNGVTEERDIKRPRYRPHKNAYIPLEFSVAAYRFGHSMVRGRYNINGTVLDRPIFLPGDNVGPTEDLRGRRPLPSGWRIDWPQFLPINGATPQPSRTIDSLLVEGLFDLPGSDATSLPLRNLRTGQARGLPSGQDVAQMMRLPVLSHAELGNAVPVPTPLWFYLLKEAELPPHNGARLGPVGGRIVAEVLLGLLELDRQSYFSQQPTWQPSIPAGHGDGEELSLSDLVVFASHPTMG